MEEKETLKKLNDLYQTFLDSKQQAEWHKGSAKKFFNEYNSIQGLQENKKAMEMENLMLKSAREIVELSENLTNLDPETKNKIDKMKAYANEQEAASQPGAEG